MSNLVHVILMLPFATIKYFPIQIRQFLTPRNALRQNLLGVKKPGKENFQNNATTAAVNSDL